MNDISYVKVNLFLVNWENISKFNIPFENDRVLKRASPIKF